MLTVTSVVILEPWPVQGLSPRAQKLKKGGFRVQWVPKLGKSPGEIIFRVITGPVKYFAMGLSIFFGGILSGIDRGKNRNLCVLFYFLIIGRSPGPRVSLSLKEENFWGICDRTVRVNLSRSTSPPRVRAAPRGDQSPPDSRQPT